LRKLWGAARAQGVGSLLRSEKSSIEKGKSRKRIKICDQDFLLIFKI